MMFNKKTAAMFGLDARIKKYSHAELVSVSSIFSKTAAMFGLDARIALAIFGALSVITGAALYSAINKTKVTTYITEFNELGKALEAYMLDTGQVLPFSTVLTSHMNSSNLVENTANVAGWKGPYLSSEYVKHSDSNGDWVRSTRYVDGRAYLRILIKECTASGCNLWARVDVPASEIDIVKQLDLEIDGADTSSAGDFRYSNNVDDTVTMMQYKYSVTNKAMVGE